MNTIERQIEKIRREYETNQVFEACTKRELSDYEVDSIIDILKVERDDGHHRISDDIVLTLTKGRALITDNLEKLFENEE